MSEQRIKIAPLAALNEQLVLVEFYRNRVLVLANENLELLAQVEQLQVQIKENQGVLSTPEQEVPGEE